jgi:enoyl-[acyl-carrier protein] reductase II
MALRTALCELLGLEHPVIQGSIGPWTTPELPAAVSNAGGLGSVGTALRTLPELKEVVSRVRELTQRPFAINHTLRPLDDEAFTWSLEAKPKAISLAIGARRELVERTHEAGALFIQQVHTVAQAEEAAEFGADVIIAQGWEAGGFSGFVGTMALIPQVVDAVAPVPVVAAGGIADGRGLAAALVLGAQGINIGTRFVASEEARVQDDWKRAIVEADSLDAVKVEFANQVFPPAGDGGYSTLPRALRTEWIDRGNADPDFVEDRAEELGRELAAAARERRAEELVPFTGQTTGLIDDVLSVAEIMRRLVEEAERALASAR